MADQEVKHSPLPWSSEKRELGTQGDSLMRYQITIHSEGKIIVFGVSGENQDANAALILTAVNAHAALTERVKELNREAQRLAGVVSMGIKLIGGWREAVVELEDFCSERVRLKNMICAADQMDEWKSNAEAALAPKEKEHAA